MGVKSQLVSRAGNIAGIPVVNPEEEDIGEIEDVVIELEHGKVAYAVLNFRDWFRNKLFAVPWSELTLTYDEAGRGSFILDTTREQLKAAPGFDPKDWPDVASDEWREEVDAHYEKAPKGNVDVQSK